jgi:thiamine biosynthesis lipoprotein
MGWNIGIRKPNPKKGVGPSDIQQIVTLQNQSMATSGDYQNFFQHEGQRFSHILDPNTGYPVQHNLCSVTVVAPSCALADGLATACLVLGSKLSLEWIKLFPGCEIYMMERSEDDSIQSFHSKNFPLNSSSQNK